MPFLAIPAIAAAAIGGGATLASSLISRSASNNATKTAAQIQQDQLALSREQYNKGLEAWQPAKDYWTALLQGGPAATAAVGPYAAQLRQQGTGAARTILSTLPAGGERNLALAQNSNNTYSQIRRLTAGVQPQAASALGSLANPLIGASTATSGQATSLAPSLINAQQNSKTATAEGARGLGTLIYNAINKNKSRTGGGGGGIDPWGVIVN